jgi:VWFA-related protein
MSRLLVTVIAAALLIPGAARPVRSASGLAQNPPPVFSARVDLAVLHAVVHDVRGNPVTQLSREAFTILENGHPQPLALFVADDSPMTVGLLLDSSGSMRGAREDLATAVAAFADASNPRDELFALSFNERVRAALPNDVLFTNDRDLLLEALARSWNPVGRTALYDAIRAGAAQAARGRFPGKALIVVSDGGDNASAMGLNGLIDEIRRSNVVVYAVIFADPLEGNEGVKPLRRIAELSGGTLLQPHGGVRISAALERIAGDIRYGYTLAYTPSEVNGVDQMRRLEVEVRLPGGHRVLARTRREYIPAGR